MVADVELDRFEGISALFDVPGVNITAGAMGSMMPNSSSAYLAARITCHPLFASSRAVSSPMPVFDPVTIALLTEGTFHTSGMSLVEKCSSFCFDRKNNIGLEVTWANPLVKRILLISVDSIYTAD